jgi:hypothetical protein
VARKENKNDNEQIALAVYNINDNGFALLK